MSSIYYTLLTNAGASAMAYAAAHATAVDLAEVALGDGNGSLPTHTPSSTTLVNEVYRANINSITQDPDNAAWYIVELVVPPEVGDFWVREFRIDDADGNPIYIGVTAPEFKPILASGMTRDSIYRLIVETANAATITLMVDPSIVMATHAYVLNAVSAYIPLTQRAAANGVATLDSGGKVPLAQLPDALATEAEVIDYLQNNMARRFYFGNLY
ncbi:tail fiber repeat 2 protein [Nitrosomonas sp. Is79A3]|uniref:phage tail-collar fiber domain-containing protein n=1 Tax=Nitrosomonas sp. (strain Is79A3) TaxID=261292 RepID=UPI000215D0E3